MFASTSRDSCDLLRIENKIRIHVRNCPYAVHRARTEGMPERACSRSTMCARGWVPCTCTPDSTGHRTYQCRRCDAVIERPPHVGDRWFDVQWGE